MDHPIHPRLNTTTINQVVNRKTVKTNANSPSLTQVVAAAATAAPPAAPTAPTATAVAPIPNNNLLHKCLLTMN